MEKIIDLLYESMGDGREVGISTCSDSLNVNIDSIIEDIVEREHNITLGLTDGTTVSISKNFDSLLEEDDTYVLKYESGANISLSF